jgi:hypothetical protein
MTIASRCLPLLVAGLTMFACGQSSELSDRATESDMLTSDAAPPLTIDSLDGEVTKHEVDTFIAAVSALPIPISQYPNGSHNNLADGRGGTTLEGINRMYEIASEIPGLSAETGQILDLAIAWSDAWLVHRNDLPLGEHRVMWTGNVEPIWPPDAPPSTYAACEVGETVGILAYTALNVARTPALWNKTIADRDPNGFGATYLARAKTYVAMLEHTMDAFFNKQFLNTTTLTIQHPSSAAYNALGSNNVNAWNRMMMFLHAWQTLSEVHAVLGDDAKRATMYKTITKNTVDLFVANALPRTAPDGTAVYDWGYGNFGDEKNHKTGEQIGIHAQYDIWGLTRAYRAGYTSATAKEMQTYADTVVHELTISPGVYAGYVDRCCGTQTYSYLPDGFMYLVPYNPAIYENAATADINSGHQKGSPGTTATILWAKHWLHAQRGNTCQKTSCAAQKKTCGNIDDGCGGSLSCGACPSGQTCSNGNVCQTQGAGCDPSVASYSLGKCGATVDYQGKLYKCISQAAGVNGEPSGCGATGVYCSTIAPDNAAWGSTAWEAVATCP